MVVVLVLLGLVGEATVRATPSRAQTTPLLVNVPGDRSTIQAAIDAVAPGGAVVVGPGTYAENLQYRGKAVEVRSSAGPAQTIIDGASAGPVVSFTSREQRTSVLRGFTLRNGLTGVTVQSAAPVVTGNVITGNSGSGLAATEILDNLIERNGGNGAPAVELNGAGPAVIRNNVIRFNSGGGGGLSILNQSSATVVGNVIAWSSPSYIAGLLLASDEYLARQVQNDFRHAPPATPNVRYVKGLFYDVLFRIPAADDPGLTYWVNDLSAGRHRYLVALAFLYSRDAHELYLRTLYQQLLHRAPDPSSFQFWVDQLQRGMRREHVLDFFVGRDEFYNRVANS